jgi:hypothetical protein
MAHASRRGTAEAKARLQELAGGANPTIAEYAKKRLDHWDEEKNRKL